MSDGRPIYLDSHATTPCDPRVVEAMTPFWGEEFGNPATRTHSYGWAAEQALETAREEVADAIGARSREIVFTSGATEANNLVLFGIARAGRARGNHIVVCRSEHRSVLDPCRALTKEGFTISEIAVDRAGQVDLDALREAIGPRTLLVSLMHANNEIGVIQPIAEVARVARERGVPLHTDAAQSVGRIPVDVEELGVDLLSISGHKIYGPKGVGALYVRRRRPRIEIEPILHGGGHERGLRSGTLPVPLCVGLGRACSIAEAERESEAPRIRALRDHLWARLQGELESIRLNGDPERRLPGNLNVSFLGVESSAVLLALPDLALSAGSACTSSSPEPTHVLRALGLPPEQALGSIRIGLGRFTTLAEIDQAADRIVTEVRRLRELSPRRKHRT